MFFLGLVKKIKGNMNFHINYNAKLLNEKHEQKEATILEIMSL